MAQCVSRQQRPPRRQSKATMAQIWRAAPSQSGAVGFNGPQSACPAQSNAEASPHFLTIFIRDILLSRAVHACLAGSTSSPECTPQLLPWQSHSKASTSWRAHPLWTLVHMCTLTGRLYDFVKLRGMCRNLHLMPFMASVSVCIPVCARAGHPG